jgi:phosphoglucosamine mutase
MIRNDKKLSELTADIPIYPQVLLNVPVRNPRAMKEYPGIISAIKKAEKQVNSGRILVRPSGTEPKVRVMVEGNQIDEITAVAEEVADVIKKNMT